MESTQGPGPPARSRSLTRRTTLGVLAAVLLVVLVAVAAIAQGGSGEPAAPEDPSGQPPVTVDAGASEKVAMLVGGLEELRAERDAYERAGPEAADSDEAYRARLLAYDERLRFLDERLAEVCAEIPSGASMPAGCPDDLARTCGLEPISAHGESIPGNCQHWVETEDPTGGEGRVVGYCLDGLALSDTDRYTLAYRLQGREPTEEQVAAFEIEQQMAALEGSRSPEDQALYEQLEDQLSRVSDGDTAP